MQIRQHRPVAVDSSTIPLSLYGFYAAPLQTQPECIITHSFCQGKIAFGSLPPVGGFAATFACANMTLLFPAIPLVIRIATFILMRRSCRSPEKSFRETEQTLLFHVPPLRTVRVNQSLVCGFSAQISHHRRGKV